MQAPEKLLSYLQHTSICLSLTCSMLTPLLVQAKEPAANSLPPLAPEIKRSASSPESAHASELPPPSAAPEGEMPLAAPEIHPHRSTELDSSRSSNLFNLHAQTFDLQAQQGGLRIGRPTEGSFESNPALSANTDRQVLPARIDTNAGKTNGRSLTQVELQKLAAHDVVLLIDRSASMASMDCPNGAIGRSVGLLPSLLGVPFASTSRWNWCLQQTSELSRQTQNIYDKGITVILFSTGFVSFPNVTLDRISQIFGQNSPAGGTNLAQPLAVAIGDYLQRREYTHGNTKPVMIGVITDGCPNNRQAVRESIIQATQLMRRADEITIIFFLVGGMDFMGERFVNELVNNLPSQGARFPIVKEVSFGELQRTGLARAIAQNLQ